MSVTTVLKEEHQVILGVLTALEKVLEETDENTVPADFLRPMVRFSRLFIDRCHHGKEEDCLFPCMEQHGFDHDSGPIGQMLLEHEQGRALTREIDEMLDNHAAGTVTAAQVRAPAYDYLVFLRQHIDKEDNILYPMGDQVMTQEDQTSTQGCYDKARAEQGPADEKEMRQWAASVTGK